MRSRRCLPRIMQSRTANDITKFTKKYCVKSRTENERRSDHQSQEGKRRQKKVGGHTSDTWGQCCLVTVTCIKLQGTILRS